MLRPDRIRQLRQAKQLAQWQLAEQVGTDQVHISLIERGERKHMSVQTLVKLADALDVSTDYLLGRTDFELSMQVLNTIIDTCHKEIRQARKRADQAIAHAGSAPQVLGGEQEEAAPRPRRRRSKATVG